MLRWRQVSWTFHYFNLWVILRVPGGRIPDDGLLATDNGLGDERTNPARTQESGERSDDMNEKDDEIAHLSILTRTAKLQECQQIINSP